MEENIQNKMDLKLKNRVEFILSEYKSVATIISDKAKYYTNKILNSTYANMDIVAGRMGNFILFKPRKVVSKYGVEFLYSVMMERVGYNVECYTDIYVLESNGLLEIKYEGDQTIFLTRHFMDRYLTRMGWGKPLKDMSIESVYKFMLPFFTHFNSRNNVICYEHNIGDFSRTHKDWYDATACLDSGMICVTFISSKVCIYKTFIHKDDFKGNQLEKWQEVMSVEDTGQRKSFGEIFSARKMLNKC